MSTVYDAPQNLLNVLGTFWSANHPNPDGPAAIVEGTAQLGRQQARFLEFAKNALAREQIELFRQDDWYWLTLSASNRTIAADGWFEWAVPSNFCFAAAMFDKMYDPAVVLMAGSDMVVENGVIRFREDPLTLLPTALEDNGDTTASCWLYGVQVDEQDVYEQYGYAVGLRATTSRQYKQLMNAVYDAIVATPTLREITLVLSAATGIPVGISDGEIVELVVTTTDRLIISTDKNIYIYASGALPTVTVGDTINAGDTLTDALVVQLLGVKDLDEAVLALGIDEGLLSSCFRSGLIFDNKNVPLIVDTAHPSGFTKVSWQLGGRRDDVEHFFKLMHDRGITEAMTADATCLPDAETYQAITPDGPVRRKKSTLAHLLDNRTTSYGEPGAAHLPTSINPCQFLTRNIFRGRAIFASVNLSGARRDAAHLVSLAMQKILPPEQTLIFQVALTPIEESITVDLVEDATSYALALATLSDEIEPTDVEELGDYRQT